MRIDTKYRPSTIKVDFKATNKTRNKVLNVEGNPNDESDREEVNLTSKLT